MGSNLEIKPLIKRELKEHLKQNTFWKDTLSPLPKSKIEWLIANPRIDEDDYCGLIGYEDQKMISFIFMHPDMFNSGATVKKAYWMISWWVDEAYKNTVLGTYIYNEAVNLADKQVIIKSYAENVTSFYEKQPFKVIASRLRHTIFFSLDTSMIIGRFRFLKPFRFFLNIVDTIISTIIRKINAFKVKRRVQDVYYESLNGLDAETWEFIKPLCENDLVHKTKEYVNWQLDNSQYVQTPIPKRSPYTSLQAGMSDNIHIHNLKIIREGVIIGFLSYIINYKECNIKYFLVEDEKYYDLCVDVILENFIKKKGGFIFTDDTQLSETIAKRYKTIFTHKVIKKGLAHNDTKLDYNNVSMLNRDGHFY